MDNAESLFANSYLAKRDRWFGFGCSDSVRKIEESAFTIASSLSGVYDLESKRLRFKSVQNIRAVLPGFLISMRPERTRRPLQPSSDSQSSIKIVQTKSKRLIR